MKNVFAMIALTVCLILIIIHTVFTYGNNGTKIYDCAISEISPDYPIEVKEQCRKMRKVI
jgi:hypothetical protein